MFANGSTKQLESSDFPSDFAMLYSYLTCLTGCFIDNHGMCRVLLKNPSLGRASFCPFDLV